MKVNPDSVAVTVGREISYTLGNASLPSDPRIGDVVNARVTRVEQLVITDVDKSRAPKVTITLSDA